MQPIILIRKEAGMVRKKIQQSIGTIYCVGKSVFNTWNNNKHNNIRRNIVNNCITT